LSVTPVLASESGPLDVIPNPELPPSIAPVIILKGSNYEMGYQYFQQLAQLFGSWILENMQRKLTEEELNALAVNERYLKAYTPQLIDYFKGMADGATDAGVELTYNEVLANFVGTMTYPGEPPPPEEKNEDNCSAFSVWGSTTTDGRLIAANSTDATFDHSITLVAFPEDGNNWISSAPAGGLPSAHPGMNNAGLFIGASGGFARRPEDTDWGLPRSCHYLTLLQYCNNAEEAKNMFLSWEHLTSSANYHFSDISGNAYVVEWSSAFKSVREPGQYTTGEKEYGDNTNFIYSTNNYFTNEGCEAILGEEFIEHCGWLGRSASISSVTRNMYLWNMLHNYHGNIDLEFVKMMWRFPGTPPPEGSLYPCDPEVRDAYYDTQGKGWNQVICNLDNNNVGICLPDKGDNGVMYVCLGPAGKVAYPLAPGADYYQIEGTHTFYELALAANPNNVVNAAKTVAHHNIAKAYSQLMWLNYSDTGYAALNELYSKANAEYYEGVKWHKKANSANGDKQLLYYSCAATAFTRSQCHAQQVYEALVPAPTSPKDLGLKPYTYKDLGR
ncbi:MAG: hypothetical protein GX767_02815, partial [Firmicutes bacterium]|nr:hypothetical protein [Bacillota bacterium]